MSFASETGARRSRVLPVLFAVLVAFGVGIGVMVYVMTTRPPWLAAVLPATPQPLVAQPAPAPSPTMAAGTDAVTLATREANLAATLAMLEARATTIDADTAAAADRAGQAEAILISFAARRALDRGVGLGYLEEQLKQRFGASIPKETAAVIRAARAPVTVEDLRESLDATTPAMLGGRSDWWAGIGSELRNLFVIHRAGTPSPLPSDRLTRAKRMLNGGNVEAALAEVERLPGAEAGRQWIDAARRYVEARRALDTLEAAAITGAISAPANGAHARVTQAPAPANAPAPSPSTAPEDPLF